MRERVDDRRVVTAGILMRVYLRMKARAGTAEEEVQWRSVR